MTPGYIVHVWDSDSRLNARDRLAAVYLSGCHYDSHQYKSERIHAAFVLLFKGMRYQKMNATMTVAYRFDRVHNYGLEMQPLAVYA
jgi:hypothetical protein